ncbi:hypothetical protein DIPPA_28181 [Diplonema papillatum]|nr:hypothetical protein DIPPA_28181 [Diplonema papillatum]
MARKSSRAEDQLFDQINADIEAEIQRQLAEQAQRVDAHRVQRETAQQRARAVADRVKGGDKIKLEPAPPGATEVRFGSPAPPGPRQYRAIASHNRIVDWVSRSVLEAAAGRSAEDPCLLAVAIPPPAGDLAVAVAKEVLAEKVFYDVFVRAVYFSSLFCEGVSQCHVVTRDADEKRAVLPVLRDLRQNVESEGFDWFL